MRLRVASALEHANASGWTAMSREPEGERRAHRGASGRDGLAAAVARVWDCEAPGTVHLTLNAVIEQSSLEPIVASTLLLLVPPFPSPVAGTAEVRQRVRRTSSGWRISSRTIKTAPARRMG